MASMKTPPTPAGDKGGFGADSDSLFLCGPPFPRYGHKPAPSDPSNQHVHESQPMPGRKPPVPTPPTRASDPDHWV
jgi:hypothetical protein